MDVVQGQLERRVAQRFGFQLPVSLRLVASDRLGRGFTQNLSTSGALVCTDLLLCEAAPVELTFILPGEITLSEDMPVRCQGRVLRVDSSCGQAKYAAAIRLEKYEFLPESDTISMFRREREVNLEAPVV